MHAARMKDEAYSLRCSLLKTHSVKKCLGSFYAALYRPESKTTLLCRGVFLFVSGRGVPPAADSLRANRFFLSPRNTVHRNTQRGAYHRERMLF